MTYAKITSTDPEESAQAFLAYYEDATDDLEDRLRQETDPKKVKRLEKELEFTASQAEHWQEECRKMEQNNAHQR